LHTTDGQRLYAVEAGSGETAVVLVPESPPGNVCGWLPYVASLQRAGFRVLTYDYRGTGGSPVTAKRPYAFGRDLAAAVARVRADGADKVVAAGASFGGVVVMQHAGELDVDGVVSFSGETTLPEYHVQAIDAVPQLHAPLLIVGSRQDSYLPVSDARRLLARAGSADKQLLLYPGDQHGWDIVQRAPYAARARARVLAWLRDR
jgi:dienelactone hydrolase